MDHETNIRFNFVKTILDYLPKKAPLLGICYGAQFLNVHFGGSLIQDIREKHNSSLKFDLKKDHYLFSEIGETMKGSCYHH